VVAGSFTRCTEDAVRRLRTLATLSNASIPGLDRARRRPPGPIGRFCGDGRPPVSSETYGRGLMSPCHGPDAHRGPGLAAIRRLMGGHTVVYRATGGRIGHRFPGSPPMLLLVLLDLRSLPRLDGATASAEALIKGPW
jgi:hypothetical protein